NGWSYHHCRRQWSLADNPDLRYGYLLEFDKAMIALLKKENLLKKEGYSLWTGQEDKVLIYGKGNTVFAFNFNPSQSFEGYFVPVHEEGTYSVILTTDEARFGGAERVDTAYKYKATRFPDGRIGFMCYLPQRCATVFKKTSKKI
ncbi:MAG: alpha amylase C-terminal domain-containing protein, partial [Clostridia bacterium]|nr:alpha amylase C-terminal domain-containing protein [Clostridia bacterium]